MVEINKNKCIKCSACISDCVVKVLKKDINDFPYVPEHLQKFCLNCQHCLAICPEGAVNCNGVNAAMCAGNGPLPAPGEMMNLLRQRRSIRRYRNENIAPEVLAELKSSLAWSATGCNADSLIFKVIEKKEDMEVFRAASEKMLKFLVKSGILKLLYPGVKRFLQDILNGEDVIFRRAPHMIICAVNKKAPCKEADPFIALSNFDLLAQSFGLGTCWCGFAVYAFKFNRRMRAELALPKGYKVASVLLFGKTDVKYKRATAPAGFTFI